MANLMINGFGMTSVEVADISADPNSIYPKLNFNLKFSVHTGNYKDSAKLSNLIAKLYILSGDRRTQIFVGNMFLDNPFLKLMGGDANYNFYSVIDYNILKQLEKLRNGDNLVIRVEIKFEYSAETYREGSVQPNLQENQTFTNVDYTIPKSTWVENILNALNYKEVFLVEMPKLNVATWPDLVNYINYGWRDLANGDYPNVLSNCQRALEKIKTVVKETKPELISSGKIDFGAIYTDSSTSADAIDTIYIKLWTFLQPGGRHIGRTINREDAEFAFFTTYNVINIIIKNLGQ